MSGYTIMRNTPIQMIASCSTIGEFTPIRFRYETPDCSLVTVNILSVENRKHTHTRANHEMIYVCRGIIDGDECNIARSFCLRYYVPNHCWTLMSIGK